MPKLEQALSRNNYSDNNGLTTHTNKLVATQRTITNSSPFFLQKTDNVTKERSGFIASKVLQPSSLSAVSVNMTKSVTKMTLLTV